MNSLNRCRQPQTGVFYKCLLAHAVLQVLAPERFHESLSKLAKNSIDSRLCRSPLGFHELVQCCCRSYCLIAGLPKALYSRIRPESQLRCHWNPHVSHRRHLGSSGSVAIHCCGALHLRPNLGRILFASIVALRR